MAGNIRPPNVNVEFLKGLNLRSLGLGQSDAIAYFRRPSPKLPPKLMAHRRISKLDADKCAFVRRSRASIVQLSRTSIFTLSFTRCVSFLPACSHILVGRDSAYHVIKLILLQRYLTYTNEQHCARYRLIQWFWPTLSPR